MATFEETPETAQGQALFRDLQYVHSVLRRDLETVRRLAREVPAGLPAQQLQAELKALETQGPLWQLKVNCLRYCQFVHGHHRLEDVVFFPALRRANPALGPVVDRLESDHVRVSELLDEVEASAAALGTHDDSDARARVSLALDALADHLIAHLAFEEREAGPTIRRLQGPL